VIRAKIGNMIRKIEALYAWLELVTYQMNQLPFEEQQKKLSGPIALLKVEATTTFEYCTREAVQVYGGLGYTRGGQAEVIVLFLIFLESGKTLQRCKSICYRRW
jgi:alkylation response protein AidB-like acyl-CoA dehydrogenase